MLPESNERSNFKLTHYPAVGLRGSLNSWRDGRRPLAVSGSPAACTPLDLAGHVVPAQVALGLGFFERGVEVLGDSLWLRRLTRRGRGHLATLDMSPS
jgi:hypothetical protein